ncbi:MAG TPA: pilus assembly protein TadG-related protein [Bryobacteraceae bacterium]|nr:pilus assembly protein TadG-related protein [Bryobacteraceae bacterium]
MHPSKTERGQATFLVMLALIPICLAAALVVDVGMANYTKMSARTAAQTAALAAVQAAMDGIYQGGTYACGSQSLGCQSTPGACPTTGNLYKGCLYATSNGFSTGTLQTVLVDAGIGTPPVANITSSNYWVRVRIMQSNPLTFGAVSGMQSLNVAGSAVAAAVNVMPMNCVVALSPTAPAALDLTGNVTLTTTDCGIAVNSSSTTALTATGSTILSASSISVVGGASTGSTTVTPTPTTGVTSFADPLEGVPAPTVPSGCSSPTPTVANGVTTYYPGNYCTGITIPDNSSAVFSPGTYFLINSGLTLQGNPTVNGTGVTFYLTSTTGSTCVACTIDMQGNPSGTLSAPTSGSLQGILFFGDRSVTTTGASTIQGNSSFSLAGAAYLPHSALTMSRDATGQQIMLIANTVSMNGNVTLSINPESATTPLTAQISAALIQ